MKRKNVKELLPIIKAFAEGKQIQFFNGSAWINLEYPTFNEESRLYRIKPEPKYRPFKSVEECWNEMQKHQPFGWIKFKKEESYCNISAIYKSLETPNIYIDACVYTFSELFDEFTFVDDSPFGIKEE